MLEGRVRCLANEIPPFIRRLIEEHALFLNVADALIDRARGGGDRRECLAALTDFCHRFFEDFHHRKEEDLLFPVLGADPRIHAGGPECVLHYDQQMRSPPIEVARRACGTVGIAAIEFPWRPELQRWRDKHSPLTIPLEDHEAGRILLRAVEAAGTEPEGQEKVLRLLEAYRDLQANHIRKENGCLFCLARTLISPGKWADLERREPVWTAAGLHPLAAAFIAEASAAGEVVARAGVK